MAKWRNKIEIKHMFTDDESDEKVLEVVNVLIPQLERVKNKENKILEASKEVNIGIKVDEDFIEEFINLIEEFKWIKESIEKEVDCSEFEYENWCEGFNNYLDQLFDMGDTLIVKKDFFNDEKFLWVG